MCFLPQVKVYMFFLFEIFMFSMGKNCFGWGPQDAFQSLLALLVYTWSSKEKISSQFIPSIFKNIFSAIYGPGLSFKYLKTDCHTYYNDNNATIII